MELLEPAVITAPLGGSALSALKDAVREAQSGDLFARVVVVADHPDVASAVRHLIVGKKIINVTAQTGERLAAELARPMLRPLLDDADSARRSLDRLHEFQTVRQVADDWLPSMGRLDLSAAGRRRLYAELAHAFRQWEQRPAADDLPAVTAVLDLPSLYDRYHAFLEGNGYHTRYELPRLAANALASHWPEGTEPAVIYYLPRHPSAGELELMQALVQRDKCRVIIGLTGDDGADEPALALCRRLSGVDADATARDEACLQKAVDDGTLSLVIAPDPVEEARGVVRCIAAMADEVPFYRIAVVHRQETPYASLLRQELAYAEIPFSGVPRRTLADTTAGRFLLGMLALAAASGGHNADPVIDREQLIDLLISAPLRFPPESSEDRGRRERRRTLEIPGVHWANLAREAHANGTVDQWTSRLRALVKQQADRKRELFGDPEATDDGDIDQNATGTGRSDVDALIRFVHRLAPRLQRLHNPPEPSWGMAKMDLKSLLTDYHVAIDSEADDRASVEKLLDSLTGLESWGASYSLEILRDAVANSLQSPVSGRGNPVGSGVYVGPPAGIVGADYHAVFVVGMIEGQFPPPHRTSAVSAWLNQGSAADIHVALERYEFLGAVAAAGQVVLSYPVVGADRRAAYPSRWLLDAANLMHKRVPDATGTITSENLAISTNLDPRRTVISSRENGLRQLSAAVSEVSGDVVAPSDRQDYNLMHLLRLNQQELAAHPAWTTEPRMIRAVTAAAARRSKRLTDWDGKVGGQSPRISGIGSSAEQTVSPTALETWANCPYRFFLNRVLGLSAPPSDDEDGEISALDRGTLVHAILGKLITKGREEGRRQTEDDLLAVACAEFRAAEQQGITGYPLLWEIEKEAIKTALKRFFAADEAWLGQSLLESHAEVQFDDVVVDVPDIGPIHFKGRIDRIDVLADEVRVRDFKTGKPDSYRAGSKNATQPAVQLEELPAIVQGTLDKLRGFAAECIDESDRWFIEYLARGIKVVEEVLRAAHDPAEAAKVLGDGKAITDKGGVGSPANWKRRLADIRNDFAQVGEKLLKAVRDVANPRQPADENSSGYSIANGRALQLPVYLAAAQQLYSGMTVSASYCFPLLETDEAHHVATYNGDGDQVRVFHQSLAGIIGSARRGIFPATPDGDGQYSNCRNCDFNRLCPTRRRQMWERKGSKDDAVQPFNALGGKAATDRNAATNDNAD